MIRGKTLDAAIFNQAGERSFHGPVPIRFFGVAVDFPPCCKRLGRCEMNVTSVSDLPVYVARSVVANPGSAVSRLAAPAPDHTRSPARHQGSGAGISGRTRRLRLRRRSSAACAGPASPASERADSSPVWRPREARPARRSTTADQSSERAQRPVLPPLRDCLANRACTRLGSDRDDPASPAAGAASFAPDPTFPFPNSRPISVPLSLPGVFTVSVVTCGRNLSAGFRYAHGST